MGTGVQGSYIACATEEIKAHLQNLKEVTQPLASISNDYLDHDHVGLEVYADD